MKPSGSTRWTSRRRSGQPLSSLAARNSSFKLPLLRDHSNIQCSCNAHFTNTVRQTGQFRLLSLSQVPTATDRPKHNGQINEDLHSETSPHGLLDATSTRALCHPSHHHSKPIQSQHFSPQSRHDSEALFGTENTRVGEDSPKSTSNSRVPETTYETSLKEHQNFKEYRFGGQGKESAEE
jgi:hypothetical protein